MKTTNLVFLLLLFATLGTVSCARLSATQIDTISLPDSTFSGVENSSLDQLQALPDTSFSSIKTLTWTTTVFDTAHSPIINDLSDPYEGQTDILTFRCDQRRSANFGGTCQGHPDSLSIDWSFTTLRDNRQANIGTWGGGAGWTGQPTLKGDTVIATSLSSRVYFIDFNTGDSLRTSINVHNPIKGSAMLDPKNENYLYVGHGVCVEKPWGCMTLDLSKGEIIQMFGEDRNAWRKWGAYDSSPLRIGQFIIRPGENGTLYKWYVQNDTILLHSTLRYKAGGIAPGMEASMTIYRNYGYTADNYGHILCTNLNTMRPVWHYDNHDDTDASLVLEEENGTPFVYTGCEVDKQDSGFCYFVKLNGITGERVWEQKIPGRKVKREGHATDGGLFATPLPGRGNCSDLIFISVVTNYPSMKGDFIAIEKATGKIRYTTHLLHYPWMSPVGFMNEDEEEYIVAGDTRGRLYLIEGKSGQIITSRQVGSNFEASPIVRDNHLIVGSRGNKFYRVSVQTKERQ